jgi:hypothetical protein
MTISNKMHIKIVHKHDTADKASLLSQCTCEMERKTHILLYYSIKGGEDKLDQPKP